MVDTADWSNEQHVRIVCDLFAEQVKCGNRSNTHLNNVGFKNVIEKFKEKISIEYKRLQFKNKWAKLKADYTCWKTLLKQTGLSWDERRQIIDMPESWWKKARKDIPGCGKFKGQRLQNEENLRIMFEDLHNTGDDHFCAAAGFIPEESPVINVAGGDDGSDEDVSSEEEDVAPPSKGKGKRCVTAAAENSKRKRPKTSGGLWMQEQVSKMVSLHELSATTVQSMAARNEDKGPSIKEVMEIVKNSGAPPGTKEHFIATELFTKRSEREMFLTMDEPLERLNWLIMKYITKYGNQ